MILRKSLEPKLLEFGMGNGKFRLNLASLTANASGFLTAILEMPDPRFPGSGTGLESPDKVGGHASNPRSDTPTSNMKISIIGIGRVGETLAYTIATRGLCRELVLVSRNRNKALGDAHDLQHAQSFVAAPARITAGDLDASANSDIIAFCASAPMTGGDHIRRALGPQNTRILRQLLPALIERSPGANLIMLSNPVDALTYFAIQFTGLPPSRVMGAGTLIDSARLRALLSDEVNIHPDDIRAYILGEHGATQFPAMSIAVAGGEHIENNERRRQLFETAREAGLVIYRHKGYTNFAIAQAATAIIESMALDEKRTMPLSTLIDGYQGEHEVCLSVPVVVGREGILRVMAPELSLEERAAFKASAAAVREMIRECAKGLEAE